MESSNSAVPATKWCTKRNGGRTTEIAADQDATPRFQSPKESVIRDSHGQTVPLAPGSASKCIPFA